MANAKTFARSFTGGEVTPEFFGRIDDAKFQTGLETCRNFMVKPHGPVENRSGLGMVNPVKYPAKFTRLIPATYAIDETMVIEIGEGYFRAHSGGQTVMLGGVPYEVANSYAEADLATIKYVQSNDVITFTHPNYEVSELRRYGPTNWVFTTVSFEPSIAAPTGISATATPATTTPGTPSVQTYTVTAVNGADESLAGVGSLTDAITIIGITQANPGVITAFSYVPPPYVVGDRVYVSGVGGMSALNDKYYKINTISTFYDPPSFGYYTTITLKDDTTGTPIDTTAFAGYTGGGTVQSVTGASCSNNLFDDGAYNTIVWAGVTGAERYYVYKLSNGLFGYIGQTQGTTFRDDNIASDISKTPPLFDEPISGVGQRPGAVSYFEQRRCFAGSIERPANFWATKTGTESNLSYSIPQRDDDSIRFKIAARERNTIRHIVPMNNLLLLTEAAEWRVSPAEGEVLTPNVSVRPQSFIGAGHATPAIVNNNLIFAAARGGHVRELAYNWEAAGYLTGDISLRAPHLFDNYEIADLAYGKAPIPTVWAVSTSGDLLGFTYVPEQEVGAWHRHDTQDGAFESIAVVAEGEDDILYAVVRRDFGAGPVRYVERMASRHPVDPLDYFFVDCGRSYYGPPATIILGLGYLEGQTVAVVADGADLGQMVVTGGIISLDEPASLVHVGLPIQADIKTLPLAFDVRGVGAFGQGVPKNISKVWLRVYLTRNVKAGPTFDRLTEVESRTDEPPGVVPKLATEELELPVENAWDQYGQLCIRQDLPMPMTLVSLTIEFAVGG